MYTVKFKLIASFTLVILVMCSLIAASLYAGHQAASQLRAFVNVPMNQINKLGELESAALRRAVNVRDLSLNEDVKIQTSLIQESTLLEKRTSELLMQLKALSTSPAEQEMLTRVAKSNEEVSKLLAQVTVAIDEARFDEVKPLVLEKVRPRQMELTTLLRELNNLKLQNTQASTEQTTQQIEQLILLVLVVSLMVAMASGAIAWWVSRSITNELGGEPSDAVLTAKAIANGDLSTRFIVQGNSKGKSLMDALNEMQASLIDVVTHVRSSSDNVAQASAEIAQSNQNLSCRTEQQASALEQTAASMEQLGTTVRQTAENAIQANGLAANASDVAGEGGRVVQGAVGAMRDIFDSSKRIADIIGVIDGIAFQTNILALNAAVEAARAGEQGRGFAVVASEVRSLAQRSASAAREIKSLIAVSVERVEQGVSMVEQAGTTMTNVVVSIKQVADLMNEISAATQQQGSSVSQVCEAMSHMDKATQENAAVVEQSAAAAEALNNQALELVAAVASFKLIGAELEVLPR